MPAGLVPSEALGEREGECPSLCRFWGFTSDPRCSFASGSITVSLQALPSSARGAPPLCLCVQMSFFLEGYLWTGLRATLLQDTCKDLMVTRTSAWGYDFVSFSGDPVQPTTRGNSGVRAGTSVESEMSLQ